MFAIAIWDARRQELRLYRDRPGIKPLYYYYDGRRFAFASELKALEKALAPSELEVDLTACYDFLGYRYVPAPKTLYKRCFKLPPAHELVYTPSTGALQRPRRYWDVPVPEQPREPPLETACEELRSLIGASVAEQMIADVPLGFFLSGGVDSSVVVAAAAATGRRVATFAIGFDADEASETPFAREVAQRFATDHHERILSQAHAQELLPRLKSWFDEPFADESSMPTYLVCSAAREHVTVVLTGDGGDEVFGGYRTYPRYARYARWPTWPPAVENLTYALRRPFPRRHPVTRALSLLETAFSTGPNLWAKLMGGMSTPAKARVRARARHPARLRRLVALPRVLARRLAAAHAPAVRRLPHLHAGSRADEGRSHEHGRVARSSRTAARAARHRVFIWRSRGPSILRRRAEGVAAASVPRHPPGPHSGSPQERASAFRATT